MNSGANPAAALRRARAAIIAAAIIAAAGCAGLQSMLNGVSPAPITGAASPSSAAPSPAAFETPVAAHKRRRRRAATITVKAPAPLPSSTSASTPAAVPSPAPTPAVTLAGAAAVDGSTQRLIDAAAGRLNGIDRAKLAAPDAAAYDQARGLLTAALAAQRQGDDLAAASFARKASALAKRLPGSP